MQRCRGNVFRGEPRSAQSLSSAPFISPADNPMFLHFRVAHPARVACDDFHPAQAVLGRPANLYPSP
jgi:hypothetical protein